MFFTLKTNKRSSLAYLKSFSKRFREKYGSFGLDSYSNFLFQRWANPEFNKNFSHFTNMDMGLCIYFGEKYDQYRMIVLCYHCFFKPVLKPDLQGWSFNTDLLRLIVSYNRMHWVKPINTRIESASTRANKKHVFGPTTPFLE